LTNNIHISYCKFVLLIRKQTENKREKIAISKEDACGGVALLKKFKRTKGTFDTKLQCSIHSPVSCI
jgi:hypothetical protein